MRWSQDAAGASGVAAPLRACRKPQSTSAPATTVSPSPATLLVDAAKRLIAGEPADDIAAVQRARVGVLFDILARGFGDDA